ncbi:MAG: hypothetical protein JWL95_2174 [Gemmatimonadetes bacterium]|nr:hypothetical protein [Gemmatimonadota bacterium]
MLGAVALPRVLAAQKVASSDYLYLWTASGDSTQPDYLAVLDARRASGSYGKLVASVPVPGRGNIPHHTEHAMPADGRLFANGFRSGQTFIFDANDRAHPRVDGQFGDVAGMMHPHSYLRLPNGNVLATFQMQHDSLGAAPGGLAELTSTGRVVRSASADVAGVDRRIRPYSAAIVPKLDRIVTTTSDMDGDAHVRAVQVWRLSDLQLLHTINLPQGPRGDEADFTAEPRLLDDERTVVVSTFNCGLYLLRGLGGSAPSGELVSSFPKKGKTDCAIPIVAGRYYLETVPAWNAVVSLDISDPAHPREVSRLVLGAGDVPHWIALEPNRRRVVLTGYGTLDHRVVIAAFDPATGRLALDERFHDAGATEPGVRLTGQPHGAVFANAPK